MKIKRIFAGTAALFLMLSATQAQEVNTDSIGGNIGTSAAQTDSVQALLEELSQLKSQLKSEEQDNLTEEIWKRKKYWKIGLGTPDIKRNDGESMAWKTEFSVFIEQGTTAYLHSKPLWGVLKFGIDYGFMDINYSKLKLKEVSKSGPTTSAPGTSGGSNPDGFDEIVSEDPSGSIVSLLGIDLGMHKIEYGLHVGPSISVNPWNHLIATAYFHVMPTASGIIENDKFSYGFGLPMSAGISVSYKMFSVGAEWLWSSIKYKQTSFEDEDDYSGGDFGLFDTEDFKLKQKGARFYIALRF